MNVRPTHTRAPAPPVATADPAEDAQFTETRVQHAPPAVREPVNADPMAFSQEATPRADLPTTAFGHLAGAIAAVMAELKPVEKSGWNDFHKYKYAKMGDLSIELTPLMGKHGIVIFQNEIDRAMFDENRVISVRYEFTIVHRSGEIWPERPIITGMSACRTSNGKFDDKSFNKAHTAARKYFLLSLFQIPTEDEEDGDNGAQRQGNGGGDRPRNAAPRRAPSPDGKVAPHLIPIVQGEAPAAWGERFTAAIGKAASTDEVNQWYDVNASIFDKVKQHDAPLYDKLIDAMDAREAVLVGGKPSGNGQQKAAPPPPETKSGVFDDEEWLTSLDNAFSGCEDVMSIAEEQERLMLPNKDRVIPQVYARAMKIVQSHIDRITS